MLQPLAKRILIQPIIPEQKKASILILKDEAPQIFTVIAIGDDVKRVSVNDIILISSHSTSEIKYDNVLYTMIHEDNIIAKVV